MTAKPLMKLPKETQTRLDDLTAELKNALGDDLVSMIVHGSAVRGGFREQTSDVDVVIVLRAASREALDKIGNALVLARAAARVECMILVSEEIARAADVFPLLYQDIQRCHAVLAGSDPFEGLVVSPKHLRLRIEQELREAQIRLRRVVTDAMDDAALSGAITRKVRQIRSPLRALLELRGESCEDELSAVLSASAKAWKVETPALGRASEAPGEALDALVALLGAAITDVDAREE